MGIFSKLFHAKDDEEVPVDLDEEPESEPVASQRVGAAALQREAPTPSLAAPSPPPVTAPRPKPTQAVAPPRARPAAPAPRGASASSATKPPASNGVRPVRPTAVVRGDTEPMTVTPPPVTRPVGPTKAREPGPSASPRQRPKPQAASAQHRAAPSLGDDVDRAFEAVAYDGPGPSGTGRLSQDAAEREEVLRLFRQLAAEHARPLRDFAFELETGEPSRQWAELCAPSVGALRRAASRMKQTALEQALRELAQALDEARTSSSSRIEADLRARLLDRLASLRPSLPEAFAERDGERGRESIIVDALLRMVPGMHRLAIDKLYAAGVDSLARLHAANAFDLAQATGVDEDLCESVIETFARHREERAALSVDEERSHERRRITETLATLRKRQAEFREAEAEEDLPRKRKLRSLRRELVLRLELEIAQLGELEIVDEIERYPVERKIERIEAFLRAQPKKAAARSAPRPPRAPEAETAGP